MKIIQRRLWWYILSFVILIPGIIAVARWGIPLGIDFRGGALVEIQALAGVSNQEIAAALEEAGFKATVAPAGQGRALIRTEPVQEERKVEFDKALQERIGEYTEVSFQVVGPTVSRDLAKKALLAVGFASLGIILFVAWAFRRVPAPASSWRFGIVAVIALIHDLGVTVGLFVIASRVAGYEVDSLFITALLTVMGFSVHDTIVIFDRIRENLRLAPSRPFEEVANLSVNQTLGRSLGTSLTVVFVLLALFVFGGTTIHGFVYTLLVGIVVGTYSSIFIAAPLLVDWQNARLRRARQVT